MPCNSTTLLIIVLLTVVVRLKQKPLLHTSRETISTAGGTFIQKDDD